MITDTEVGRVSAMNDDELREYINRHGVASPERIHAQHVLDERHQRRTQQGITRLSEVIKEAADSSKGLEGKILFLNIVLTIATVIGAIATVFTALPEILEFVTWLN